MTSLLRGEKVKAQEGGNNSDADADDDDHDDDDDDDDDAVPCQQPACTWSSVDSSACLAGSNSSMPRGGFRILLAFEAESGDIQPAAGFKRS